MRALATDRLSLEPQVAAHAGEMFAVLSDPAIYEYENEPPASLDWLRTRFSKLESRRSGDGSEQWLNWVIRLREAGLIGYVQASVEPGHRASIAYVFSSAYWGRGLASEAVRAMIEELATHYRVSELSAVLKDGNLRSRRLLERLGFALASPAEHKAQAVETGEILMTRDAG